MSAINLAGSSDLSDVESRSSGHDNENIQGNKEDNNKSTIGAAETKAVIWSRCLVFAVLTISAVAIAGATYTYLRNQELTDFEKQAEEDIKKVFEDVGLTLDQMLGAADAFAVSMTSYAAASNSEWPFVDIPDYAVRASKLRSLTKSQVVATYPVVTEEAREKWELYSETHNGWVEKGLETQKNDNNFRGTQVEEWNGWGVIHSNDGPMGNNTGPYLPTWKTAPVVPFYSPYNWNLYPLFIEEMNEVLDNQKVVFGRSDNLPGEGEPELTLESRSVGWISGFAGQEDDPTEPYTAIYYPIVQDAYKQADASTSSGEGKSVGVIALALFWRELLREILPTGSNGIVVVLGNECNQSFSYEINGAETKYLGRGDHHDPKYDHLKQNSSLTDLRNEKVRSRSYSGFDMSEDFCPHWIEAYPSSVMQAGFVTQDPNQLATAVLLIFGFTAIVFTVYVYFNERRQNVVMVTAVQSTAIVSSLFPSNVRDRLFAKEETRTQAPQNVFRNKDRLSRFIDNGGNGEEMSGKPIAELFPDTTVMFADIAGFTSWSSVRDPIQVFTLLEALYGAFDKLANQQGVFKVETIGDCYVAVCGLPHPDEKHARTMARFAHDCRKKFNSVVQQLENSLGPGTEKLELRTGLHSGPCTAGVLRGEKSRFQLFGDTVNTASRMESNGAPGKIHVSQETADLLIAADKRHWLTKREDMIEAKGKGKLQTFWVELYSIAKSENTNSMDGSVASMSSNELLDCNDSDSGAAMTDENRDSGKTRRLMNWVSDALKRRLQEVLTRRAALTRLGLSQARNVRVKEDSSMVVEEVVEILDIVVPPVQIEATDNVLELDPLVEDELVGFVSAVEAIYPNHKFHNFEHAAHVTMSADKLLNALCEDDCSAEHNFGAVSDPLTGFACLFSCLVHDADHPGVSNAQLIKEQNPMALAYGGKCVAEQNAVDLAFSLLTLDEFKHLKAAVAPDRNEFDHFRQLVITMVMCTDIMDRGLKKRRDERWLEAFQPSSSTFRETQKATVLLEHIVQAADIYHTMQHWAIFSKWNQLLFCEIHKAHSEGRASADPYSFWFEGELGFFDGCVIPLAEKLKDCGAFKNGSEFLVHAKRNRQTWMAKGGIVVDKALESARAATSGQNKS